MAGTLVIDTLKASTGVLATQNGMTGIPKAWVIGEMSTLAISASMNVSSITKNSTGRVQVNFTTAFSSNSIATIANTTVDNSSAGIWMGRDSGGTNNSTTRAISAYRNTVGYIDMEMSAAFYSV